MFQNVQSGVYWSSSTYAGSTGLAWGVGMGGSIVSNYDKIYYYNYVWPVRGGL
jgi:hypothetical protein